MSQLLQNLENIRKVTSNTVCNKHRDLIRDNSSFTDV